MRRLLLCPVLFLPLSLLVGGCSQLAGDRGTGMTFSAEGKLVDNSAANYREITQRHLQASLAEALGTNWSSTVTITPLPVWMTGMVQGDGDWWWTTADVQVVLTGNGTLPVAMDDLQRGIEAYMRKLVKGPPAALTVAMRVIEPAAPSIAKPLADPRPPVSTAPPLTGGTRSYDVQPGDTLGDITTLFYGAPTDWRRIVAANPGLDPAQLTPGQRLVIPPPASPAPVSDKDPAAP